MEVRCSNTPSGRLQAWRGVSNSAGAQARHRAWFVIVLGCMQAPTSCDHPGCTTCRSCRSTSCKDPNCKQQPQQPLGRGRRPEDGAAKSSWRCDDCLVRCTLCKRSCPEIAWPSHTHTIAATKKLRGRPPTRRGYWLLHRPRWFLVSGTLSASLLNTHTHTHKRFSAGRHYRQFLIESFSWIPRNGYSA